MNLRDLLQLYVEKHVSKSKFKLFTKDFLDEIYKLYKDHPGILDFLMEVEELSFHDAIVKLASWKDLTPKYLD